MNPQSAFRMACSKFPPWDRTPRHVSERCGGEGPNWDSNVRTTYVLPERVYIPWYKNAQDGKRRLLRRSFRNERQQEQTLSEYTEVILKNEP